MNTCIYEYGNLIEVRVSPRDNLKSIADIFFLLDSYVGLRTL